VGAMTARSIGLLAFFSALGLAQALLEPAYAAFIVAFGLLAVAALQRSGLSPMRVRHPLLLLAATGWTISTALVTWLASPELRDVVRDIGALASFLVGRYALPAAVGRDREEELLEVLSALSVAVAVATLLGAAVAFVAGVDAYQWRGVYVPFVHAWLPYLLVANVALIDAGRSHGRRLGWRIILCVLGSLASLSRTDLLLEIVFGLWLLATRGRRWLVSPKHRARIALLLGIAALGVPLFLTLGVVEERLTAGVGEGDLSVGWRLIENLAFLEAMDIAGPWHWWFGLGLGARVELPDGIFDFNDNSSIPHLHNSVLTLVMKFGLGGLLVMSAAMALLALRALRQVEPIRRPLRLMGTWTSLFVLGKAMTLHGLTSWSHVLFFGLGCALLAASCRPMPRNTR